LFSSVEFKNGKAYITFRETGTGLTVKDKYGYLKGFTIAGSDKKFHWAKSDIVDDKTIVVYSEKVKHPMSVRYGWADNPDDVNLYNKEGLPANPFRTDNWPGITK
jgi:sialate O-acetylesterase